jgi:hypothetical protein
VKRLVVLGVPALVAAVALLAAGASAGPRTVAVSPTLKILVNKDGWYRVSQSSLTGAGFVFPPDPTTIHLAMDGQDVPFQLHNGALEFYGRGLDTLYTDTRPYFLSVQGTASTPMSLLRARATAGTPSGSFQTTLVVRDRKVYSLSYLTHGSPGSQVGNNIFGDFVRPGQPVSRQLITPNIDTSQSASLRLDLVGLVVSTNPPGHQVDPVLNPGAGQTTLASITGSGNFPMGQTYPALAPGALVQGTNIVQLTNPEPYNDAVLTDAFTLTYQHLFMADNDVLNFPASPGVAVSVGGFSSGNVRLIDISNPEAPRELFPTIVQTGGTYTMTVTPPASTSRLYAFVDSGALTPKGFAVDTPSTLRSTTNQADLIIIAYKDATHDFLSDVQPLVAQRVSQGLTVKVVNVEDVFDEFSSPLGAHEPGGIKSFLQYATTNWQNPKPKYVLLAGDASWDPRAYFTPPDTNTDYIPTLFFDATFLESPSDDALSDFDNDGRPSLGVGRLPAKTDAQMQAMVAKIVNYGNTGPRTKTALLVADNFDKHDYCFGATRPADCQGPGFSDELQNNTLVPAGVSVTRVDRADGTAGDSATRTAVLNGVNAGPLIVNWFGHGTITKWSLATPGLIQANDAATLGNTNLLSLYLMMTCQTGYFVADFNGLGEALMYAPNGAVAVWASDGDTVPFDQRVAANVASADLLSGDPTKNRLGDAMVHAKNSISDVDVMHTWVLLGDPSMRLNIT